MSDMIWQRSEDWVGTEVEGSFVMINLATGTYLTLNQTANAVWNALETPQTQRALEDRLMADFDVAEATCAEALGTLLARMRDLKLAAPI